MKEEENLEETLSRKSNGWSGGGGLLLLNKICWKTKMGLPRISALTPKFTQKF